MIDLRKTNYLLIIINFILILSFIGLLVFNIRLNNTLSSFSKESSALQNPVQNQNSFALDSLESQKNAYESVIQYQDTHDQFSDSVASNDPSQCSKLDENFKVLCLDGIYLNLALKEGDKSLCEKITSFDLKEVCLQDL